MKDVECESKSKCKVVNNLENKQAAISREKIDIYNLVKASKKYNFEECKITINEKIDTEFMKRMLHGY